MTATMDDDAVAETNGHLPEPQPDEAPEVVYSYEERTWRQLTPSATNVRGRITDASVRDLADSIVARGLLQPLDIHPGPEGDIVFGHRRYHAICLAINEGSLPDDWPIQVKVRTNVDGGRMDEGNVTLDRLVENLQRADLDPIEEARAMQAAIGYGWTQDQLATHIGVNKSHVSKRLSLLALIPELQERVSKGDLSVENALILAKVDGPAQAKLAQKGHISRYEVESYQQAEKTKAIKAKTIEDIKALGHNVRASTGPAPAGKMWVEIQPDRQRNSETWKGDVPKTTELVVVKADRYTTKPSISFHKAINKPEGTEDLSQWERTNAKTEDQIKERIKQKRKQDEAEHKRDTIREAEARALLDVATRISAADFKRLLWSSLVKEIQDSNWMNDVLARNIVTIAKLKPKEDERPFPTVQRVLQAEDTSEATKARIVIVANVLGGGRWLEALMLQHAGFDPDKVEIPPLEEMSTEEAEAIAIEAADDDPAEDDLAEDLDDDIDLDVDDARYEG